MTIFANALKRIVLIIVTISILLTFFITPSAYAAKLDIKEGEFYYGGITKGTYTVTEGIFAWLLNAIGDIIDWLIGIMTMGFRMVFVGWTALIERLLTWALETTTGVNLNNGVVANIDENGELVDNSTDLIQIVTSSDNVTVESIVFNKVPALDINFFKEGFDPTISGTGQKLVCSACGKDVDQCCDNTGHCVNCEKNGRAACSSSGKCCEECSQYAANLEVGNNSLVQILRDNLAKWYYVMRLLAYAAMLVILIGLGVKSAITSAASEKALYKRMLVDWLVGMIIIVGIHFMMLFIINANETLVGIVEKSSIKINQERMANLNLMTLSEEASKVKDSDYTNQDLEIKVYEEIRTRAYDPKLTVGLPGMIMYMTLVYFAIRYTIVYLKRYLTVMVLTLMGPGIGVAYAFQKVFHGRSPAYSKWFKEYVMNVIIQTVHAILYSVFVAEALILSLDSLAGMIIALVFLNYSLKADKLFRKIFNMGQGDSLLGRTADAGDPENVKQPFNAVKSFVKADATKEALGALANSPYAKVVKGAGKAAVAIGATAATGVAVGAKKAVGALPQGAQDFLSRIPETAKNGVDNVIDYADARGINILPIRLLRGLRSAPNAEEMDKEIARQDEKAQKADERARNAKTPEEQKKAINDKKKAIDRRNKFAARKAKYENVIRQPNALKIGTTRFIRAIDVRNTFNLSKGNTAGQNFMAILSGTFGTSHQDPITGQKVNDKNGIYSQLSFSNIANFSDSDKKQLKAFAKSAGAGLLGMAGMFIGMGTIVAHPKLGMGLLSAGAYKYDKTFGIRKPSVKDYVPKTYTFEKFSDGALNNMQQIIKGSSAAELNAVLTEDLNQTKERARALKIRLSDMRNSVSYRKMRGSLGSRIKAARAARKARKQANGNIRTLRNPFQRQPKVAAALLQGEELNRALGYTGGVIDFAHDEPRDYYVEGIQRRKRRPITNLGTQYDKMMKKFEKAADKDYKPTEAYRVVDGMLVKVEVDRPKVIKDYLDRVKHFDEASESVRDVQLALQYDRVRSKMQKIARKEMQAEALQQEFNRMGYFYDAATGRLSRTTGSGTSDGSARIPAVKRQDLRSDFLRGHKTNVVVGRIDTQINRAIAQISNGKKIDLSDERTYGRLVKQLEQNLRETGVIGSKQNVSSIFEKGKLRTNLQEKAAHSNARTAVINQFLDNSLSKQDANKVRQALFGMPGKTSPSVDLTKVTAEQVFDAMVAGVTVDKIKKDGSRPVRSEEDKAKIEVIDKYLKALRGDQAEFEFVSGKVKAESSFSEVRSQASKAALDRLIQTQFLSAGIIPNPDSMRLAKKDDFDTRNITGGVLSEKQIKQVNKEIQHALIEVGNGREVDITDPQQYQAFMTSLTKKLQARGIVSEYQTSASVIFKAGKLEEIVAKQSELISASTRGVEDELARRGVIPSDPSTMGVKAEDIDTGKAGRSYTTEEVATINELLRAAIVTVAANPEKSETRTREKVNEELTERLQEAGLIEEGQKASDIFQEGKLETAIATETARTTAIMETMEQATEYEMPRETVEIITAIKPADVVPGTKYTPEDLVRVSVEIRAAVAVASDGEKLDLRSKAERKKVVEEITERLQEAGLIEEGQQVTDVIKEESLDRILREETSRTNAKVDALDQFLSTVFSEEEASAVSDALSEFDEIELSHRSSHDIAEELLGKVAEIVPPAEVEEETRKAMLTEELVDSGFRDENAEFEPRSPEYILSSADKALINREIAAAIEKLANGGELDINSERMINEILRLVSNKAYAAGLIGSGMMIDEVLSRGSIEKVIRDKAAAYNRSVEKVEARVDEVRTTERMERVEGVAAVVESRREETELSRATRSAVEGVVEEQAATPSKRKTKLDQIVASGLDEFERQEKGDILADILEATASMSEEGGELTLADGSTVELSASEANATRQAMGILIEMRTANRNAKKKNQRYLSSVSDVTEALLRQRMAGQFSGQNPELAAMIEQQRVMSTSNERREDIMGPAIDIRDIAGSDLASAAIANERIAKKNKARAKAKAEKTKPKAKPTARPNKKNG